jgi:hypothetical protein
MVWFLRSKIQDAFHQILFYSLNSCLVFIFQSIFAFFFNDQSGWGFRQELCKSSNLSWKFGYIFLGNHSYFQYLMEITLFEHEKLQLIDPFSKLDCRYPSIHIIARTFSGFSKKVLFFRSVLTQLLIPQSLFLQYLLPLNQKFK